MDRNCSFRQFLRLAARRRRDGHHSVARQLAEVALLYPLYGVGPGYYQAAAFWDRRVPWTDKIGHLSTSAYYHVVRRLNPVEFRMISQHKLAEKAVLALKGVPSAQYLGHYDAERGTSAAGAPLRTPVELARFLAQQPNGERLCFKETEGWGGRGFEAVEVVHDSETVRLRRLRTGSVETVADFCRDVIMKVQRGSVVIERYLVQHPAYAHFNASSVNTARLWVLRDVQGACNVVLGYFRIGRAGAVVDNQSSGGIVAPIDLASGTLEEAVDGLPERQTYTRHPDNGVAIAGATLARFDDCLAIAKRGLTAFPWFRFVGLDVAMCEDGPRIVELNVVPDRIGAAFVRRPTRPIFVGF